jgi:hypothetical protein
MEKSANNKTLKIFGLSLAAAIAIWCLVYAWFSDSPLSSLWPAWIVTLLLADVALLKPAMLKSFYRIWMMLIEHLNRIITHTLLGSIFLLIITPVALSRRLLGKDALHNKNYLPGSYRIKSQAINKSDIKHPF